jgi:hypothetical protein
MPKESVPVAEFRNSFEAELARGRLEAEGIPAFLLDASAAGTLVGLGLTSVKLYVAEGKVQQALVILGSPDEGHEIDRVNEDFRLATEAETWSYCQSCGAEVSTLLDQCPSCTAPLESQKRVEWQRAKPPLGQIQNATDDYEHESRDQYLLERAWRAAVFGLVSLPVLFHLYSFWLLLKLAFSPGKTGEISWIKFLATFLLNSFVIGAAFWGVRLIFGI